MFKAAEIANKLFWEDIALVFLLIVAVIALVGTWRIFTKMDEKGWKGIIPLFNEYVVFRAVWNTRAFWIMIVASIAAGICAGFAQIMYGTNNDVACYVLNGISLILLVTSTVYQVIFCNKVATAFGKGFGMTVLLVILPFVATCVLGFGSARYEGPKKQALLRNFHPVKNGKLH